MTHKISVRMGGDSGATTKDYTAKVPHISVGDGPEGLWTTGMMFGQGRSAQFQFVIVDDANALYTAGTDQVEAHNLVTITEDASGTEYTIGMGRVARKDGGRGDLEMGAAKEHDVTCDDINIDLDGLDLAADWVRASETGTERLLAVGAAFLDGGPRLTTNITVARWAASGESHLVKPNPDDGEATMPAHTYEAGTPLVDIITDCAETEGQEWGVVLHHDGSGSHACFEYTEEDDWTTYPCTLSISDTPADVNNTTVFAPIWDQGAAIQHDGQTVLSGIVSEYGDDRQTVVLVDDSLVERFDYWVKKITDATTTTLAGATARAPHLLRGQSYEHINHQVTIKLPADKAHLVVAGMSIDIKSAASRHEETLGTYVTRRIAEVKLEPIAPEVGAVLGSYYAHLQLDRPEKIARERRRGRTPPRGPRPPTVASPAMDEGHVYAEDENLDVIATFGLDVTGGADTALVVLSAYDPSETGVQNIDSLRWDPSGAVDVDSQAMSRIFGPSNGMEVWALLDPNPATDAAAAISQDHGGSTWFTLAAHLTGINPSDPWRGWLTANGTGATSSVTPTTAAGDLVLNIGGWLENNQTVGAPTAGGSQTSIGTDTHDVAFGQRDCSMGGGWQIAAGASVTPTWAFGASHPWWAVALVVNGAGTAGDATEPVGPDGSGSIGTDTGVYAPIDHVHEHGDISASTATYHTAESIEIVDSGGNFTADDVEGVLAELAAGVGGSSDAAETTQTMHGRFVGTYHRASDGDALVMYSDDGLTFRDGATIDATTRRDPSMIHWDGQYWVALTKYAVSSFGLFSSDDLETWTEIGAGVAHGIASADNTWAPEWVRNLDGTPYLHPSTGLPCLTVNVTTDSETTFNVYELHPTNRAMTAWSAATVISGTGFPTAMIDGYLLADTDQFYLWFKDEAAKHIEIAQSASLTSGYTLLESGDWASWFANKDGSADSIEGPCVIRLPDGRWRIYFNENNGLSSIRAVYSETTDDWRTGTSTWTTQAVITTDALMSHGTVMYLPGIYDHERDPDAHADILGAQDHGDLDGLADDDHPQYVRHTELVSAGHYEVIVSGTAPPVAVTTPAEDDWVYGWIS